MADRIVLPGGNGNGRMVPFTRLAPARKFEVLLSALAETQQELKETRQALQEMAQVAVSAHRGATALAEVLAVFVDHAPESLERLLELADEHAKERLALKDRPGESLVVQLLTPSAARAAIKARAATPQGDTQHGIGASPGEEGAGEAGRQASEEVPSG